MSQAALPLLAAVGDRPSGLAPRGPAADALVGLWWALFAVGMLVFAAVVGLVLLALRRRRRGTLASDRLAGEGAVGGSNLLVLVGGVAVPAVIIVAFMALMITTAASVRQVGGADSGADDLQVIEVTAHEWWWDVRYPDHGVRTANEVHIPVGAGVEIRTASADVIHSFWVPQLGGKVDMTPGEETSLRLQADEAGIYRGLCTEYCGIQHALMQFVVVAHPPEEFTAWLEDRAEPPAAPTGQARRGQAVFEQAGCVSCHTIAGVSPETELGPDLTDFGARLTIGAGTAPNDPGHLAEWIRDPHALKQGVHMPPAALDDEELDALITYLESLQ